MTKDYSRLIGKRFGDRTIVAINLKERHGVIYPSATCECKCGRVHEVELSNLLHKRSQKCAYCSRSEMTEPKSNNKLGIRYIYFDSDRKLYVVQIIRNGKRKKAKASTLAKAKQVKAQFLKEFENEASNHD